MRNRTPVPRSRWLASRPIGVAVLLAGVVASAGADPAGAVTPKVFTVSPTGMANTCTPAAPCGLRTALNHAASGDEIVLETGSYRTPATAFTTSLSDEGKALNIHGATGQKLPVIYSKAQNAFGLSAGSAFNHVEISSTGTGYALSTTGATVDHVAVFTSGNSAIACSVFGSMTDSVCDASGPNGVAMSYFNSANSPVTTPISISGVTALATGSDGIGIHVTAGKHATLQLAATNTISVGTRSVLAESTTATSTAIVKLDHCAVGVAEAHFPKGTATISTTNDVSAAPVFIDPATNDFREKPSSPTVNAGAPVPGGDTDLLGNRRVLGSAPDIGAFELPEKPVVGKLKASKVTKHVAHLTVPVNAEGLTTKAHIVITAKGSHKNSKATTVGSGHNRKTIHLVLHGLKHDTKYRFVAKAVNSAGTATSAKLSVRTH